jgi:hypothetical protein
MLACSDHCKTLKTACKEDIIKFIVKFVNSVSVCEVLVSDGNITKEESRKRTRSGKRAVPPIEPSQQLSQQQEFNDEDSKETNNVLIDLSQKSSQESNYKDSKETNNVLIDLSQKSSQESNYEDEDEDEDDDDDDDDSYDDDDGYGDGVKNKDNTKSKKKTKIVSSKTKSQNQSVDSTSSDYVDSASRRGNIVDLSIAIDESKIQCLDDKSDYTSQYEDIGLHKKSYNIANEMMKMNKTMTLYREDGYKIYADTFHAIINQEWLGGDLLDYCIRDAFKEFHSSDSDSDVHVCSHLIYKNDVKGFVCEDKIPTKKYVYMPICDNHHFWLVCIVKHNSKESYKETTSTNKDTTMALVFDSLPQDESTYSDFEERVRR